MNFFRLNWDTEYKNIGAWKQLRIPDKYWEIKNNFKELNHLEFPSSELNLNFFRLKKGAIKTDVLSVDNLHTSIGLFVSEKVKKIIENHNHIGVKFYKSTLIDLNNNDEEFDYYFMHIIDNYAIIEIDTSQPLDGSIEAQHIALNEAIVSGGTFEDFDLFKISVPS